MLVAERTRRALEATRVPHVPWHVTASLGVAACGRGDTVEDWMRRAGERLYEAKRTGRNMTCG